MTQQRGTVLQDPFLNMLRKEHIPVSIFLVNGIKLQGHIESFDQFVVLLRNTVNQMIYKHAISTIVPARQVRLNASSSDENTHSGPSEHGSQGGYSGRGEPGNQGGNYPPRDY